MKFQSSRSSTLCLLAMFVLLNVSLSSAMLPPPMLRAVCGAFADAEEMVGNQAMSVGKAAVDLAMKPIAIVGGLKAAAVGTGMKVTGGAIKFVGGKMVKDGAILEATGAGVKGAGLGVAALGLKPAAEKIVAAGNEMEGKVQAVNSAADKFAKQIGDTSIQLEATIDSPALGHHHKLVNVTGGLDAKMQESHSKTNMIQQQEDQQQQVQQQQVAEAQVKTKRAAPKVDPEVVHAALNLVKEAKMEDCVARAICDLNCNPQGFGQDGKQLFMTMVRLQGAKLLDATESKYFQESAQKGRNYSGKCEECTTTYSKCNTKSSDLIKMASRIKID